MFDTFIAHCAENGIHGTWGLRKNGYMWVARIKLPDATCFAIGLTRSEALDRVGRRAMSVLTKTGVDPWDARYSQVRRSDGRDAWPRQQK